MKKATANRVVLTGISGLIVCGGLLTLAGFNLVPDAANAQKSPETNSRDIRREQSNRDLTGEWHQTKGRPGVVTEAQVSMAGIQIYVEERDGSSSIYWMGSFDSRPSSNTIVSVADPDAKAAMSRSIFGSGGSSKVFTYKDGALSFEFTMLGTTNTIELKK